MRTFTAVVEKCPDTHLYVGYVPGFPGAHSQGATLDELNENLKEVIEILLDDAERGLNLNLSARRMSWLHKDGNNPHFETGGSRCHS
jgi:predicted RNase H-like HicB family nuclease